MEVFSNGETVKTFGDSWRWTKCIQYKEMHLSLEGHMLKTVIFI